MTDKYIVQCIWHEYSKHHSHATKMKYQMLLRMFTTHTHTHMNKMMQSSVLTNTYNNLCSPMPTTICARQCLQQSVLTNAQQSVLANAYNNSCSPLPTAICACQCLQHANAYNNLCLQGPASYNHTQIMRPGFDWNVSCAMATFVSHLGLSFQGNSSVWSVPFPECECWICGMEFLRLSFVTQRASFNQVRHLSGSDSHKLITLYTEHSHWQQSHEACQVNNQSPSRCSVLHTFFYYFQSWVKVASLM